MEIANKIDIREPSIRVYSCYRVASHFDTILEATQVGNLKDQYILGEQLGWGQFGVIRGCSDKLTGEVLACKSIAKDRLVTYDDARSIKLEIEIMSRLSGHPNVVSLKAVYEDEHFVHLLMELCAGGELFHRLEKQGRYSETDARVIFRHLMHVVKYCHANGVVHRDLKPENILLATTSSSSPIKLADFGLATYIKPGQKLHGIVGSPFYIAPEVLTGGYNQSADVWSAGVILYILLSGVPPFWGKTKSSIFDAVRATDLWFPPIPWGHISASAKQLIAEMLYVDPSRRLTSAQVLAHPWMEDCAQGHEELYNQNNRVLRQLQLNEDSFSISHVDRNRDFSFSEGSPTTADGKLWHSPAFTCKSYFSSFLDENSNPCHASVCFSFRSCTCESSPTEFSSPIPSMPSFTFFSPSSAAEEENILLRFKAKMSSLDPTSKESNVEKLLELDCSPAKCDDGDLERKEFRRGGTNVLSRVAGIHSKRNHTIGLGELDQLNLIVTKSVIRWASCTHIPTVPSLRLSLVC
ncbi:calcium-dependent protein kinase 26 isoform X1 [Argentina anserina]|uniref:calcium-dependent protein kinase 26 isoform X1 n=1 Tax=Argentina anserina TaxID=57926 RepID=UPI002176687C|nr:calcium-dependent protein kinase 26 isoform X1 [Potentilla anserina]XP_050376072.1 calcium-dependent protein kinase 26 isoform X1 [Potentilla anserina]XP_050376073.1 calcium-dependent protein kinase 26 isoform X1 [Potentilla anserina]XP_050376074.1 calcium-dependent protein kinase 26 isoform X1 [Potentilla anserina]